MRAVCGTARPLKRLSLRQSGRQLAQRAPCQIGQVTVFAEFSGLHRVRITVALMMVAEHRLGFLDVTGPG